MHQSKKTKKKKKTTKTTQTKTQTPEQRTNETTKRATHRKNICLQYVSVVEGCLGSVRHHQRARVAVQVLVHALALHTRLKKHKEHVKTKGHLSFLSHITIIIFLFLLISYHITSLHITSSS
jgi:hypothetical protein